MPVEHARIGRAAARYTCGPQFSFSRRRQLGPVGTPVCDVGESDGPYTAMIFSGLNIHITVSMPSAEAVTVRTPRTVPSRRSTAEVCPFVLAHRTSRPSQNQVEIAFMNFDTR